ncbi:MAG: ABC transporter ATP-binding protein [Nostoc sp.]|uniref:ABC transporter ATP-binding protein n=1 Tax=Nostoc sp. TaxID=1180 RepID=UPI002FFA3116
MIISIHGFKWFWQFFSALFKKYWTQTLLLCLTGIFQLGFYIWLPFAYKLIFDRAINQKDIHFLIVLLSILIVAFLIYSFAGISQDYLSSLIGAKIVRDIRLKMIHHLQNLTMRFFAETESGEVLSNFAQDLADIERVITIDIPVSFYNALLFLSSALLLFVVEWRLALVTWIALPIGSLSSQVFGSKATQASYQRKQDEAKVISLVQETINAQAVIRNFRLQDFIVGRFSQQVDILLASSLRSNFISFLLGRFSLLNIVFIQVLILVFGAFLAIEGNLTVGSLVGFISLLFNVNVAADALAQQLPNIIKANSSMLRLKELFTTHPMIVDHPQAVWLSVPQQEIAFKNVSFSYSGQETTLHNINLTIKIGQSVAFVGPSGSGKSTILNLLTRLYEPDQGAIAIDKYDIREVTQASLQSHTGIVFQDSFLFNTTIRENILLGNPDATDADIEAAAEAAEIHHTILSLPQGYDTIVGDRGGKLSGGQRQRIAIARALLRNPAIFLLDEATASLDPQTEAAINTTINRLAIGRTLISVTHRLVSAIASDQIFVLDRGRLVEQGSHQELLQREGLYYRLWKTQAHLSIS